MQIASTLSYVVSLKVSDHDLTVRAPRDIIIDGIWQIQVLLSVDHSRSAQALYNGLIFMSLNQRE